MDEGIDLFGEILGADGGAAADLTLGDEAEPSFDLVEPGSVGWRGMEIKPQSLGQSGAGLWVLVGVVIVDHDIDIEIERYVGVDMAKEAVTRRFVENMLWITRTGCAWRLLPEEYGARNRI